MAAQKEEAKRTPHFLWCQDMDRILLRLEINDVKVDETKLDITRDTFSFSYKNYELKFSFRFPVNPKTIKYRATRLLELVIEKETSNAYWPHLLPKDQKKKLKNQCKVDWDRFMDEDDAKKRQKGVVDDDNEYGNLGNLGGNESSSDDDSDDKPIDDLEVKPDENKKSEDKEEEEEEDDEEMPPLQPEEEANNADNADKVDTVKKDEDNKDKNDDNKSKDKGDDGDKDKDKTETEETDKAKVINDEDAAAQEVDID